MYWAEIKWHDMNLRFDLNIGVYFLPLFPPPWRAFLILPRNITGGEEYGCLQVNTFSPTFPRPISARTGSMEDKSEDSKAEVSPGCLRWWNKWEMRVCLGDVTNCLRGGGGVSVSSVVCTGWSQLPLFGQFKATFPTVVVRMKVTWVCRCTCSRLVLWKC